MQTSFEVRVVTLAQDIPGLTQTLMKCTGTSFQELVGRCAVKEPNYRDPRLLRGSAQAVGIRKGAPRPDISTPEAFKAAILNAKSVAYPDPAGGGLSGVILTQLAEKMGFAEQLKSKAKFPPDNFAGKLVASGEAELAIQQKPELMAIEGVEILGPLPPEINVTTVFSAGVSKDAKESGASMELLKYLESPEGAAVFKRDGLDPPPAAAKAS